MFMLLEMVRASIRKEMAPVFSGSITLFVNRHRFPWTLRSSIFISRTDLIDHVPRNKRRRDDLPPFEEWKDVKNFSYIRNSP